MFDILALDKAVRGVASIDGVCVGNPADKATWRIDFQDTATPDQRAAGQAVIDAFSIDTANANQALLDQIARLEGQQTDRRVREALAGTDGGWLANLNSQIAALRAQLK